MKRSALSVLGCPRCFGSLRSDSEEVDITEGILLCDKDGIKFPVRHGIPELVRPERVSRLDSFALSYGPAWERANQVWFDPDQLLSLPYLVHFSRNRGVWNVKARSMEALLRFLGARPPGRVLDLGSGNGWLSAHLARQGYETYAVDAVSGSARGLSAAEAFVRSGVHFERIRGEIEFPPFQNGVFDAVVCNASLHYTESLGDDLRQISRILACDRHFVMMNSPVHNDAASAERAQRDARRGLIRSGAAASAVAAYHHYSVEEVRAAMNATFGSVQELTWDPGLGFRVLRRTKAAVLGMELASFPIFWAVKSA